MSEHSKAIRHISLSVSVTVGLYGVAFGAAAITAGFSIPQIMLLSLFTFSGASQFAAVGVIGAAGSPFAAIASAGLLGTRNTLYGVQMAPHLGVAGWRRAVAAHVTIDESVNVGIAQKGHGVAAIREGFWWTGLGVYVFWNLCSVVGAVGAKSLGDPAAWGLDAAVPAAFLGLLWPRLVDPFHRVIAVIAMAFSLGVTPFVPAGVGIIATGIVAVIAGWRER